MLLCFPLLYIYSCPILNIFKLSSNNLSDQTKPNPVQPLRLSSPAFDTLQSCASNTTIHRWKRHNKIHSKKRLPAPCLLRVADKFQVTWGGQVKWAINNVRRTLRGAIRGAPKRGRGRKKTQKSNPTQENQRGA